ncbi:NAD(P)-binding protein [Leucogyrophana mollusca]|uniref:NAD(P)-binding protein n=1 Tax=Leucogyrophana mollusca TaxID=85980 RepID=A0ACB8AXG9_9AGAM|nr:NAD(P)-binding protein [Leucogyrophana mollusca]
MVDILVIDATGITGRLIAQYLSTHSQRSSFTFGLAGRSQSKLNRLVSELSLDAVPLFTVDVTNASDVDSVVQHSRVVINTVGPYWRWGTSVVSACVRHGKHYVDLTGEPHWVKDIVGTFDYAATKTGSIIVPCCGFDSVPSDLLVFLANKTLKSLAGPSATIDTSTSVWKLSGAGLSGGTVASMLAAFEEVPRAKFHASSQDFSLSPVRGVPSPRPRTIYTLPFSSPPVCGPWFPMAVINRQVVFRTWGLHELAARVTETNSDALKSSKPLTYGTQFKYEEFLVLPTVIQSLIFTVVVVLTTLSLLAFPPARWLARKFLPKAGEGPSDDQLHKGFVEVTNITTSPSPQQQTTVIRSTFRGRGEPGYLLAAIMVVESALCITLNSRELPELGKVGGVLTPMSAFGDVLIERLRACERFEIESEVVLGKIIGETRKTR